MAKDNDVCYFDDSQAIGASWDWMAARRVPVCRYHKNSLDRKPQPSKSLELALDINVEAL